MYSSIGGGSLATAAEMARRAEEAVKDGFSAVKIRMDYGPNPPDINPKKDLEMLRTVRKAIGPDIELGYDVNNGYTPQTAIRVGKGDRSVGGDALRGTCGADQLPGHG